MNDVAHLLSAYLDDELTATERDSVDSALLGSTELCRDLDELRATRTILRGLPEVEPRRPLVPQVPPATAVGGTRRPRRLALSVLSVAAVWLVVLSIGVNLGSLPVVPDVDQLALQHASASSGEMDFRPMTSEQMAGDPAVLGDIGSGMVREGIFQSGDLVQVRYSDGSHAVSVFHQPGELDLDDMPDSGEVAMMPTGPAWVMQMHGMDVLVTQRGDLIVTVVADSGVDHTMTVTASTMVPEVKMDRSLWDRILDAPGNLLDRF